MTRHNLCVNPALKNNNTGWTGNGTAPVRTDVSGTGEGFTRQYAARYIDGTFASTANGAVVAGTTYTFSLYRYFASGVGSNQVYIEWTLSAGGPTYVNQLISWNSGVLQRVSISGAAPANAISARLILDGPYSTNRADLSELLIEATASLDTYFDGDSPNAAWDGTDGNSASTLTDTVFGAASLAGSGTMTASGVATAYGTAALTGTGTLTAAGTATAYGTAGLTASGTMVATGTATAYGTAALSGSGRLTVTPPSIDINTVTIGPAERGWSAGPAERSWAIGPAEV